MGIPANVDSPIQRRPPGPGQVFPFEGPGSVQELPFAQGGSTLRPAPLHRAALFLAGLMSVPVAGGGCENYEVPLADVPRVAQPDPVPIDKLPRKDRPRVDASARAAMRLDRAKLHAGPPR
jgi:hypothetical protein